MEAKESQETAIHARHVCKVIVQLDACAILALLRTDMKVIQSHTMSSNEKHC